MYYLQVFAQVIGYTSRYTNYGTVQEPFYRTDSVKLVLIDPAQNLRAEVLSTEPMSAFHAAGIFLKNNMVTCALRYSVLDTVEHAPALLLTRSDRNLEYTRHTDIGALNDTISAMLNYYDGTDNASAGAKSFRALANLPLSNNNSLWEERVEGNYYKEVVMWDWNDQGKLQHQYLVPRRIFFFPNRTSFRQLGAVAVVPDGAATSCFVLENRYNQSQDPKAYRHTNFNKQTQLRHGSLVQYRLENGAIKKRTIFENAEFDYVPLKYLGWDKDFVLYLNKSRAEKFVILKDCRF